MPVNEPQAIPVPSSDGVTVVAHDHGGDGPPLLFCHATGFCGRYWDPICRRLADRWRCIAMDFRGHGDSVVPDGVAYGWPGMADDVLSVIDGLGLAAPVAAVGHSMGGASIILAELARPGTIAEAWLFEPILIPSDGGEHFAADGPNPLAESARRRREIFDSRDAAYERYASRPPFSGTDPEALRAYVDHGFADQADGTVILKCRGAVEAAVFDSSRTDAFERLGEVSTAIVVAGSGDAMGPAAIAPLAAEALPNGTYEAWPDLTHFAPMEDPERIAAAIRTALG